jgi:imidazolonepropionase
LSRTAGKCRTLEVAEIPIVNEAELLTLAESSEKPLTRKQMWNLGVVRDGALAIHEDKILEASKTHNVTKAIRGSCVLSAKGKIVLPGFVDPTRIWFCRFTGNELEGTLKAHRSWKS